MNASKAVLAIAGAIVLTMALLVALYLGGWWLFADRTRREGEIRRDTFEFQQGSVDAAQQKITEIKGIDKQLVTVSPDQHDALVNQRQAIVDQTCRLIARINGTVPLDIASFQAKEC